MTSYDVMPAEVSGDEIAKQRQQEQEEHEQQQQQLQQLHHEQVQQHILTQQQQQQQQQQHQQQADHLQQEHHHHHQQQQQQQQQQFFQQQLQQQQMQMEMQMRAEHNQRLHHHHHHPNMYVNASDAGGDDKEPHSKRMKLNEMGTPVTHIHHQHQVQEIPHAMHHQQMQHPMPLMMQPPPVQIHLAPQQVQPIMTEDMQYVAEQPQDQRPQDQLPDQNQMIEQQQQQQHHQQHHDVTQIPEPTDLDRCQDESVTRFIVLNLKKNFSEEDEIILVADEGRPKNPPNVSLPDSNFHVAKLTLNSNIVKSIRILNNQELEEISKLSGGQIYKEDDMKWFTQYIIDINQAITHFRGIKKNYSPMTLQDSDFYSGKVKDKVCFKLTKGPRDMVNKIITPRGKDFLMNKVKMLKDKSGNYVFWLKVNQIDSEVTKQFDPTAYQLFQKYAYFSDKWIRIRAIRKVDDLYAYILNFKCIHLNNRLNDNIKSLYVETKLSDIFLPCHSQEEYQIGINCIGGFIYDDKGKKNYCKCTYKDHGCASQIEKRKNSDPSKSKLDSGKKQDKDEFTIDRYSMLQQQKVMQMNGNSHQVQVLSQPEQPQQMIVEVTELTPPSLSVHPVHPVHQNHMQHVQHIMIHHAQQQQQQPHFQLQHVQPHIELQQSHMQQQQQQQQQEQEQQHIQLQADELADIQPKQLSAEEVSNQDEQQPDGSMQYAVLSPTTLG